MDVKEKVAIQVYEFVHRGRVHLAWDELPIRIGKQSYLELADKILAIIKLALPELAKEASWKSPEEVAFFTADVAKAEGYVKLVDIIKDVERSSHPMNTNMYGISLSSVSWEAIKSKYLKQASLNQI